MRKRIFGFMLLALCWLTGMNAWALDQVDGVYQLGTTQDFVDFVALVNDGELDANAVLTADIDYSGQTDIITTYYGQLDGAGHTLTVAFNNQPTSQSCIIKTLYGRVINLRVAGTIITKEKWAAGITQENAGYIGGCVSTVSIQSTVSGDATHGGIAATAKYGGVTENCAFYGSISGVNSTNCGGIVGWCSEICTIKNCLVVADLDINVTTGTLIIARNSGNNCKGMTNCYYNTSATGFNVDAAAQAVTKDELASGAVVAMLNAGQDNAVWTQEGDALPMPTVSVPLISIATAQEFVDFANKVNDYNGVLDAVLTADIDMANVEDYPMIGRKESPYKGNFDGGRHTIKNFVIEKDVTDVGLFSVIAAGARIHDFVLDENSSIKGRNHTGLVGLADKPGQCWLYNLGNEGNVNIGGNAGAGGILGNGTGSVWAEIDRCYMLGTVLGNEAALISGWQGTNQGTVSNCWAIAEPDSRTKAENVIFRHGGSPRISNCWSVYGNQAGHFELEEVANGGLCYKINKNVEKPVWFQKLGVDPMPTLYGTDVVYAVGTKNCDGSDGEGFYYSNEDLGFTQEPHDIDPETGFCRKCGQMEQDEEGYYLIRNAAAFVKFGEMVNGGMSTINARLTADLDMTGVEWVPIGDDEHPYKGIFNGQRHKISNLVYVNEEQLYVAGLFGTAMDGAQFKDFYLDKTCSFTACSKYLGAIVGHSTKEGHVAFNGVGSAANVINSDETTNGGTAAILGNANDYNKATFDNCWAVAYVEGRKDVAVFSGWLGNVGAYLNNCWAICELPNYQNEDKYLARFGGCTFTNCYSTICPRGTLFPEGTTVDDLATGMVCYFVNGDQSDVHWFQNLEGDDVDAYPLPWSEGHKQVYANGDLNCDGTFNGEVTYSNTQETSQPHHDYENGFCSNCGTLQKDYLTPVDDVYQLATEYDVAWFAAYVNQVNNMANACLTDDIDMSSVNDRFAPIGAGVGYGGVFDGQNHTIHNLDVTVDGDDGGFIGTAVGGMHVKNLILDENCTIMAKGFAAGLVGGSQGSGTIQFTNLLNHGTVKTLGTNASGIMGCNHGSSATYIFTNCGVTGTILSGNGEGGAICGWAASGATFNSCWSIATIEGAQDNREMARCNGTPTAKNCYCANTSFADDITKEEVTSGALAWKLNGYSFMNPTWFQTIGEDDCPTWISTHNIVYPCEDAYESFDPTDANSYMTFRDYIVKTELERMSDIIACQALIDSYVETVNAMAEIDNFDAFCQAYIQLEVAMNKVDKSAKKYAEYDALCKNTILYLAENDFYCDERIILENYLMEAAEPSDLYPNGTYTYVIEHHVLTDEQVTAEIEFVNNMLTEALRTGYVAGSEITNMLTNPTFADGFNGWEVDYTGSTFTTGGVKEIMPTAEAWNCTFDMNQTLEGLHNGVYEVRVNAAYRAAGVINNPLHVGMLYANNNVNYVMMEGEDYVSLDDAEDGVNCHLTGSAPDYTYVYGADEGYVPQGPIGCSYAFNAGRYVNSTIAVVTDGTLTVGLKNPGTGLEKDWMGFGNFRLFYLGDAEQGNDALAKVLDGYKARAEAILNYEHSEGADFYRYPNFSADLKEALEDAVEAIDAAATGEQKVALVGTFSQLFNDVYACRSAYIQMIQAAELAFKLLTNFNDYGYISADVYKEFCTIYDEAWTDYAEGNVSAEEALAYIERFNVDEYCPEKIDGVYQLKNANELGIFALLVNSGLYSADAVLVNDIDMTDIDFIPIGFNTSNLGAEENILYSGHFDGQGHKISNLVLDMPEQVGVGLFGSITTGADIRNLILDASCSISGKDRAGLIGRSTKAGEIYLSCLGNEGTVIAGIAPAGILGNANNESYAVIDNCYSTGEIIGTKYNAAQICGWLGAVGGSITNCWSISDISGYDNEGVIFYRSAGSAGSSNCFSTRGTGTKATVVDIEQFASGEVTYLLNAGETEKPVWYQTIGSDAHPVLDITHGIVVFEDGKYLNRGNAIDVIAAELGSLVNVYDAQGRLVRSTVKANQIGNLPAGLYILKGEQRTLKAIVK